MVGEGKGAGKLRRAARLTKLGAEIIGSGLTFAASSFLSSEEERKRKGAAMQQRNAHRIREELQHLRGPAMKLGQMLSLQSHLLDSKAIEELSRLQMKAPAMHPTLMRAQFRGQLGKNPEEVFETFEAEPFAAASLGQVHRATARDGSKLAVKIQYPAVREMIETDFFALKGLLLPARLAEYVRPGVIEELRRGILLECDYINEARNISRFEPLAREFPFVRIPKVYPEWSAERVLTMSMMEGAHLDEFLASKPAQELRNRLGAGLLELFCFEAYTMGALHADPHPGNYLFENETISLLDFGCVKDLNPDMVQCIRDFSARRWSQDSKIRDRMLRVIRGPKADVNDPGLQKTLDDMIAVYSRIYNEDGVMTDFGDAKLLRQLTGLVQRLIGSKFLSPDFLFYSRAEMGLYMMLHRLGARIPAFEIAARAMGL